MMTSSNGNIFRGTSFLSGEFTGHRSSPLTKANDAEFYAWSNMWANNGDAGDLRRHGAHYNVTVMI